MFSYRITKYNPKYRDESGVYLKDDWTPISDIGNQHDELLLTLEEYKKNEDAYINAIILVMNYLQLTHLEVMWLEKPRKTLSPDIYCSETMSKLFKKISSGMSLDQREISDAARLILREALWCKLEFENKMFVHFADDYYMYIGSFKSLTDSLKNEIEETGLFVEEFESPYL